ncbi:hypothetical protein J6590_036841 [Homalodisca vitripennis]|nr:hypothetical protein J6590_036841 [Homalodisca vitripennis]
MKDREEPSLDKTRSIDWPSLSCPVHANTPSPPFHHCQLAAICRLNSSIICLNKATARINR